MGREYIPLVIIALVLEVIYGIAAIRNAHRSIDDTISGGDWEDL